MKLLPKNRYLRLAVLGFFGFALFLAAIFLWRGWVYRESLAYEERMLARLDAEDPDWRWEKIIQSVPALPDDRNSFLFIENLVAKNPKLLNSADAPEVQNSVELPKRMDFDLSDAVGAYLGARSAGLAEARKLADMPESSVPIKYGENFFFASKVPDTFNCMRLAYLLQWDARMHAQLGKIDLAVRDVRAIQNTARSLRSPGVLFLQIERKYIDTIAVLAMQELLAWNTLTVEQLALLQREFLDESRVPLLVEGLRFERISSYQITKIVNGNMNGGGAPPDAKQKEKLQYKLLPYRYPPYAPADRARLLEIMTEAIALAKSESPHLLERMDELQADSRRRKENEEIQLATLITDMLAPAFRTMAMSELVWKARLRSAATALAAERFRLANGRWPGSLQELAPKFIEEIPNDPFMEGPLKLRALPDGLVIYSVGADRNDDQGQVLGNNPPDVGFRLWNPEVRRK